MTSGFAGPAGHLAVGDPGGGPGGAHDFEADLPGGSFAAIEVTGEVEQAQRALESLLRQLPPLTVPGSRWRWHVAPGTRAKTKIVTARLPRLLADMERAGRRSAHCRGDLRDALVQRLRDLGIESVYAWDPRAPHTGGRYWQTLGAHGGWGWDGAPAHAWLAGLFASPQGVDKVVRLRSVTTAAERHLAIVLDPRSQAWMAVGLHDRGAGLPTLAPPEPLTHLWLMPMVTDWPGLRWARGTGWAAFGGSAVASEEISVMS